VISTRSISQEKNKFLKFFFSFCLDRCSICLNWFSDLIDYFSFLPLEFLFDAQMLLRNTVFLRPFPKNSFSRAQANFFPNRFVNFISRITFQNNAVKLISTTRSTKSTLLQPRYSPFFAPSLGHYLSKTKVTAETLILKRNVSFDWKEFLMSRKPGPLVIKIGIVGGLLYLSSGVLFFLLKWVGIPLAVVFVIRSAFQHRRKQKYRQYFEETFKHIKKAWPTLSNVSQTNLQPDLEKIFRSAKFSIKKTKNKAGGVQKSVEYKFPVQGDVTFGYVLASGVLMEDDKVKLSRIEYRYIESAGAPGEISKRTLDLYISPKTADDTVVEAIEPQKEPRPFVFKNVEEAEIVEIVKDDKEKNSK
jgi:hypothetical protein